MDIVFNITLPVFGVIFCGYLAGILKILDGNSAEAVNRFVYFFALPPLLFSMTAKAPIHEILNWPFISAYLGGCLLTIITAFLTGRFWFRQPIGPLSLHMFSAVFANTAYMGIPVFLAAFGPDGTLPAVVATVTSNLLLISTAVAVLEVNAGQNGSFRDVSRDVARALVKNPIVISSLVGIVFAACQWPVPGSIQRFLDLMGNAAGPAALFSLGLSLVNRHIGKTLGEVSCIVSIKMLIHPALTWILVAFVFKLDPAWGKAAVLLAAMPAGALTYVVAQQYDVHVEQASATIVLSTALSILTLTGLMMIL